MTELKEDDNDPTVIGLMRGARENLPDLCAEFYGKAEWRPMAVNERALRIAAENKSYRAFEKMLEIAGECPVPNTPSDFNTGQDWKRIEEIAKTDKRIARALQNYDRRLDEFYGPGPAESTHSEGWLQRLGLR